MMDAPVRAVRTEDAPDDLLAEMHALLLRAFDAVVPRTLYVEGRPWRAGYVEGVATESLDQRQGSGSAVMQEASALVRHEFEVGGLSTSSHAFYERIGWERWRGPTYVRSDAVDVRSEDEDDGVMVLRFGRSHDVDLTGPISCDARRGDSW